MALRRRDLRRRARLPRHHRGQAQRGRRGLLPPRAGRGPARHAAFFAPLGLTPGSHPMEVADGDRVERARPALARAGLPLRLSRTTPWTSSSRPAKSEARDRRVRPARSGARADVRRRRRSQQFRVDGAEGAPGERRRTAPSRRARRSILAAYSERRPRYIGAWQARRLRATEGLVLRRAADRVRRRTRV